MRLSTHRPSLNQVSSDKSLQRAYRRHRTLLDRGCWIVGWRGYNVLDVSEFKHFRINHFKLFADKKDHINGIENFWSQAKRHMRKFNGVPRAFWAIFKGL